MERTEEKVSELKDTIEVILCEQRENMPENNEQSLGDLLGLQQRSNICDIRGLGREEKEGMTGSYQEIMSLNSQNIARDLNLQFGTAT